MSRLLIVGSVAFDDLELPSGDFKNVWGGSASYAALAASLFAPIDLCAVIGEDFPEEHLATMKAHGVDVTGVERAKGRSFRWAGRYDATLASRVTLDTQLNVFADFRPKIPAAGRSAPFVLLGNIHPALQYEVLEQTTKPKLVIADTMNFWIDGERAALMKLLPRVDVLVINEEEARQLGQHHNVSRAAAAIRAMGPKYLVVKRGEYGALLYDDGAPFFAPAYPLEDVVDPTGAGDSFAGGFVGYLTRVDGQGGQIDRAALRRAIVAGSVLGSFCVEDVGPQRLVTLRGDHVRDRLLAFKQLVHVEHELDALTLLR
ncbi:MAG: sugar kinase [Myxococcales bacterium]|nr:sugar kinase [Myxococcales bacterium]MBL8716780.1 sugar kinase [Myxococcales bacterium]